SVGGEEIDIDDIFVLLGGILGVPYAAVRTPVKPFGVLLQPRMVGRALDGKIKSKLDAMGGTRFAQETKIVDGAERGMDGIVTTFSATNRVGTADVVGRDGQAVVFALAIGRADRMDRRQVEDIKSHPFNARQMSDDVTERAMAVRVVGCRTR